MRLKQVALIGDVKGLKEGVDFDAVRKSLKTELDGQIVSKAAGGTSAGLYARLRPLPRPKLTGNMLNTLIDQNVTPQVFVQMLRYDQFADIFSRKSNGFTGQVTSSYASLNRFGIQVIPRRNTGTLRLTFNRTALLTWRLAEIHLDVD